MEINPNHPTIKELRELVSNAADNQPAPEVEETAILLFESAMLESGYTVPDAHEFALRMDRVLKYNLNLKRDEKVSPYEVVLDPEEEKPDNKTTTTNTTASNNTTETNNTATENDKEKSKSEKEEL